MPNLETPDEIFPRLVVDYLGPGAVGIVVAGILAGGISTYDSIGSALAAVFTRDIYARFFVKDRDDRHYLWVSRVMTVVVIAYRTVALLLLGLCGWSLFHGLPGALAMSTALLTAGMLLWLLRQAPGPLVGRLTQTTQRPAPTCPFRDLRS